MHVKKFILNTNDINLDDYSVYYYENNLNYTTKNLSHDKAIKYIREKYNIDLRSAEFKSSLVNAHFLFCCINKA